MNLHNVVVVVLLLACGAASYLMANIGATIFSTFIVPNFAISFYCLAIVLTTPKFVEALGIGVVAGFICSFASDSIYSMGNLMSEPVGALVLFVIYGFLSQYSSRAASVATFYATCASGFTFVAVALITSGPVIALEYSEPSSFLIAMSPIILITAFINLLFVKLLLRLVTHLIVFFELSKF
jgi:energy-coupling factor transport system ATP-binding protein